MSENATTAPQVLAVQNIKGGVGKTTVAVNLAANAFKRMGWRVLVVDADPQCNASMYMIEDDKMFLARVESGNLYDIFHADVDYVNVVTGKSITAHQKHVKPVSVAREGQACLDLVPASANLFMIQETAPEMIVKRISDWLSCNAKSYDLIIIDCPPTISSLSLAALHAADGVLIPMPPDIFATHGIGVLLKALKDYGDVLPIKTKIAGVVLSRVPPGKEEAASVNEYRERIRAKCKDLGLKVFSTEIHESHVYPQSVNMKVPVALSDDAALSDYQETWKTLSLELGWVQPQGTRDA